MGNRRKKKKKKPSVSDVKKDKVLSEEGIEKVVQKKQESGNEDKVEKEDAPLGPHWLSAAKEAQTQMAGLTSAYKSEIADSTAALSSAFADLTLPTQAFSEAMEAIRMPTQALSETIKSLQIPAQALSQAAKPLFWRTPSQGSITPKKNNRTVDDIVRGQKELNGKLDALDDRLKDIEVKEAALDKKIEEYDQLQKDIGGMEKKSDELEGQMATIAEKIDSSTIKSIGIIGLFVSIFAFIGLDISILSSQELTLYSAVGLVMLSAALLMMFVLLMDLLLRAWMPKTANQSVYLNLPTRDIGSAIAVLFILAVVFLTIPTNTEITDEQQSVKGEAHTEFNSP